MSKLEKIVEDMIYHCNNKVQWAGCYNCPFVAVCDSSNYKAMRNEVNLSEKMRATQILKQLMED